MSELSVALDFEDVVDLMAEIGARSAPASLHGFLSGQLSAGVTLSPEQWLSALLEFIDSDQSPGTAAAQELLLMVDSTVAQFADDDNIFYPLLPDDTQALSDRIQALRDWCEGYLLGFALVEGRDSSKPFSDDVGDVLRDIAELARVDVDDEDVDGEGENDYMQVVEYLRIGAMSIYLECSQPRQKATHDGVEEPASEASGDEKAISSVHQLFNSKLH